MAMAKKEPFFKQVTCTKIRGGKHSLLNANIFLCRFTGAGNTADNAIKDLQKQINRFNNG